MATVRSTETLDRARLFAAQTPQGFPFAADPGARTRPPATSGRSGLTDDCIHRRMGRHSRSPRRGAPDNVKLTTARDIALADRKLRGAAAMIDVRTGNGYDVHRLVAGDHVTLCGIAFLTTRRCLAIPTRMSASTP